jgi:hypothetical protein
VSRSTLHAPAARTWAEELPAGGAPPASKRRPRAQLLLLLAVAAGTFDLIALTWGRMLCADTWLDLTGGRWILAHGLPHTDALTVGGRGRVWVDQQWLAHLIYYGAWKLGGYPLVGALSSLAIAAAVGLLGALMLRRGAPAVVMLAACTVTVLVMLFSAEVRAQTLVYPLFAVLAWMLLAGDGEPRWDRRALLVLPLLVLWANLHGSALLAVALACGGLGWRAVAAARRRDRAAARRYAALALASPAALAATPYGLDVFPYYRRLLGDPALHQVGEWQHVSLSIVNAPFLLALAGTLALAAVAHRRGGRAPLALWALAAVLAGMGCYAVRNQVWFAFADGLLVAQLATGLRARRRAAERPRSPWLNVLLGGLLAAGTVGVAAALVTTSPARYDRLVSNAALRTTAAFAAAHPRATVLADDTTGTALLWLDPQLTGRVGYDARTEIYPPAAVARLARFVSGRGAPWAELTHGYDVIALSCRWRAAACAAVRRLPGWHRLPTPADAVVVVRTHG